MRLNPQGEFRLLDRNPQPTGVDTQVAPTVAVHHHLLQAVAFTFAAIREKMERMFVRTAEVPRADDK